MLTNLITAAGGANAVALRAAVFLAIVMALGSLAFHLAVWPRAGRDSSVDGIAVRMGLWSCVALLCTIGPRLWVQAQSLVDPPDPVLPMAGNILHTAWGHALLAQGGAALLGVISYAAILRSQHRGWAFAVLATLIAAATPAFMGHAIATRGLTALAVSADVIHVLAAGLWIGTLAVLAVAARTLVRSSGGESLARHIAAFHPLALGSSAALVIAGSCSALIRLPHLGDLFTTSYGRVLLVKLGLTAVVAGFGAYHSRSGERAARQSDAKTLTRSLIAEVGFAMLTIMVTAVLVGTSPEG